MAFVYRVRCAFTDDAVADRWLAWLHEEHLQDVLDAGASSAFVVRIDGPAHVLEAVYGFSDRSVFERYEREQAPRLREEGLARFPLELGLSYSRTTAEQV